MKKFDLYCYHLAVLEKAYNEDLTNKFIISGIIAKFSLQFELGWKVLKELVLYEGSSFGKTGSPREILKESYRIFDFIDETVWLHMLRDKTDTGYLYNEEMARELVKRILEEYIPTFVSIKENIHNRYKEEW